MTSTIKSGNAFGSSLNIHISWLWLLPLSVLTLVWFEIEPLFEAIVTTLLLLSSVLLTALAQMWAARRSGILWQSVTIFPVGGIVNRETRSTPMQEFRITTAGLFVNVILVIIFGALWWILPVGALGIEMEIVALFNLAFLLLSVLVRLTPNHDNLLHSAFSSVFSAERAGYIGNFVNLVTLSIFCVFGLLLLSFNWIGFGWWFALAVMLSSMTSIAEQSGEYDLDKPFTQAESAIGTGPIPAREARS